jgi:hypothetical protein
MHDYFIRQNQEQTAITYEKEDLDFETGFKKVNCIIYVYCKPRTNIGVYVGQTMQTLERRDKAHLGKWKQEFDKVYTSKSKFELKVLEKKTFTANIQSKSDYTCFIKSYGEWMDEREKYYIKKYDTYVDPKKCPEKWLETQWDKLNRDPGGQGSENHIRSAQSAFKRSLNKFRTKYWPAMQAFLKTEKAKLPCGTPSLLMVGNEQIIGNLIHCIRTGHTSVPAFYKKKMLEHGHVDNYSEGMWKQVYWPAMLAFLKTEKAKLPCGTPSLLMVKYNEKIIGGLINHIRAGQTFVPAFYKKKMLEHGHVDNYSEGMWKQVYWPAMLAFLKTEKAKLPCGTPSLLMVSRNEPIIGNLIHNIRRGHTSVPAFYKKLMLEHGYVDNHWDGMWKHVYWPLMLAFLKTEKAKLPCGTSSLLMVKVNEPIIGNLIHCIRTGHTSVPAFYKKLMIEHGHSDNHCDGIWKHVNWPAMQAFLNTEKAKLPVSGTPALLMVKQNEKNIGNLIRRIRTGHTSVPAFYKKLIDEHGMFWSTSNVAKHVLRKLGIRCHVSRGKFEIDRTVSLDPAENEEIAVCLEELRCFLLDEKFNVGKHFLKNIGKICRVSLKTIYNFQCYT